MCETQMAAEGLPVSRRVRGAEDYEDILAGNAFLSVLMNSAMRNVPKENRILEEPINLTDEALSLTEESISTEPYSRETRAAASYLHQSTDRQLSVIDSNNNSESSSSDGVIIAVHVSSSVDSITNKDMRVVKDSNLNDTATTKMLDQNYLSSEEHPSIIANSGKSELTVEEPEPITKNSEDDGNNDLSRLKATIQNLPSSQHVSFNPVSYGSSQSKDNVPPFHHSVIYHDSPALPGRARSVSYSSIIQDIQPSNEKLLENHERKERNYETGTIFANSFENANQKSKSFNVDSEINLTSTLTPKNEETWLNNDKSSSPATIGTTQKTWEKSLSLPLQQIPQVYGRPEQNYEVDEAVSVQTNGRTHGIQASQNIATEKPKGDQDKDQKVGYVVEGRNYRKYRVEERTPDGFIVGEYGVVSHDDGSLRGVRYTADGTINPRLIYDALMKFLSL